MNIFVGAWKIVDYYFETSEGRKFYPWGQKPVGWFVTDEDGNMSAQIMHETRPELDLPPKDDQAARAYHTYVAYFGKVTVDEEKGTLTTRVEGALNPAWVGGDQVRYASMEGERLCLRTTPFKFGAIEVTGTIYWEKVGGGS